MTVVEWQNEHENWCANGSVFALIEVCTSINLYYGKLHVVFYLILFDVMQYHANTELTGYKIYNKLSRKRMKCTVLACTMQKKQQQQKFISFILHIINRNTHKNQKNSRTYVQSAHTLIQIY